MQDNYGVKEEPNCDSSNFSNEQLQRQNNCRPKPCPMTPGTKGQKMRIKSNHLYINVDKLEKAFHYHVEITPNQPKTLLRTVMNLFGQKMYPRNHPAFDGYSNLYSREKLPLDCCNPKNDQVAIEGDNGEKKFQVEVKLVRILDLRPLHNMLMTRQSTQDALQCLDTILRNGPANTYISAGRCFLTSSNDQIISLGEGMAMYYGFHQSAIRGWKILLNVDVVHKAMPKSLNLLDLACELGSNHGHTMTRDHLAEPLDSSTEKSLRRFIKKLKIEFQIPGNKSSKRVYKVNDLGPLSSQAEFTLDNGRVTTVEKYFEKEKRCKLRYAHLPTVWVGSRERKSKILLPLELCKIVAGEAVNRKMNKNQIAMIWKAPTSTEVQEDKIKRSLNMMRYNQDLCVKEFGISVNDSFEQIDARILQAPSLLYADKSEITPTRGVWKAENNRFLHGATISKWTIVSFTRTVNRNMYELAGMIYKMASFSGMEITSKATLPFIHIGGRQSLPDITNYLEKNKDFDLIFVVVPNKGPQYSYLKKAAELKIGCLTQCIKEHTMEKLNSQIVGNILLKINSKLNGTNHSLALRPPIMQRPCMVMGACIAHPSTDARGTLSVAAVTASHDANGFNYNICWRLQSPKDNIIEDLLKMVKEQLLYFYKQTGCKPERIVFFRDGISEGQYEKVMKTEILAIQQACKELQREEYEPKITFLAVQKRHHTRLFPIDPKDSEDRNRNVPVGTCVDTYITYPNMQDFYLVSHESTQGAVKPTKYCILWDDNKLSNDEVEEMTYHLCHMFARCNRSVNCPAPIYYAHLAAARSKLYMKTDNINDGHQEKFQVDEKLLKERPMFFI